MQQQSSLRDRLGAWIESDRIQHIIVALIVINAITLGLETSSRVMEAAGGLLKLIDRTLLSVFVAEILVKLFAFRAGFFRNPWNLFDFVVVGIALVPSSGPLTVLRVLRVFRVLRMFRYVGEAELITQALVASRRKITVFICSVLALVVERWLGFRTRPRARPRQ